MSVPEPVEPPLPGDGGSGSGTGSLPYPGALPGLSQYLVKRYTFNCIISEQLKVHDFLNDVLNVSARMFYTQGADGKIRMHNKKPVDWALGTAALSGTTISLDDVSPWVTNLNNFVLIDPYTRESELRQPTDANYPTSQNSTTLTTLNAPDVVVTAFAGADGNSTPATATITIATATAATLYTIVLDGITVTYTPGASDTPTTVAAFIAGAFAVHPKLARKFKFSVTTTVVTITARFGTLNLNNALTKVHTAPVADPTVTPVLTEINPGVLYSGAYRVAYAFRNSRGQTRLSPYFEGTIAANRNISVAAVTPPAGCTVAWYISVVAGSDNLRFHSENNGSSFVFSTVPTLNDPLPPDVNRTSAEVMRVMAGFEDTANPRTETIDQNYGLITGSNVMRASYEWSLADRKKRNNRIDIAYRDASDDYRRIELRVHDKDHQELVRKIDNKEYNGNAIDNYFQAARIGGGILIENRDANFFYKWSATRTALLLEEGDVVAITDNGSGVINLPMMIQSISQKVEAGMPVATFTGQKYATTLYDDSFNEIVHLIVSEQTAWVPSSNGFNVVDGADNLVDGAEEVIDI